MRYFDMIFINLNKLHNILLTMLMIISHHIFAGCDRIVGYDWKADYLA